MEKQEKHILETLFKLKVNIERCNGNQEKNLKLHTNFPEETIRNPILECLLVPCEQKSLK
jgi:hypothetical protein